MKLFSHEIYSLIHIKVKEILTVIASLFYAIIKISRTAITEKSYSTVIGFILNYGKRFK